MNLTNEEFDNLLVDLKKAYNAKTTLKEVAEKYQLPYSEILSVNKKYTYLLANWRFTGRVNNV